jgi:AcrR family transcriptional regulator
MNATIERPLQRASSGPPLPMSEGREMFITAPEPERALRGDGRADGAARTRESILAAAQECLRELGIRRTSVEEVARRAQVARGTVYLHFSDKNTLVTAVLLHNGDEVREQLNRQLRGITSLRRQFAIAARVSVSPQSGELLAMLREREPEALALMALTHSHTWIEHSARFWAPRLRAAQKRGDLAPSVNIDEAAEWVGRVLYTASTVPSERVDPIGRPLRSIGEYVSRHLMFGLGVTDD